MAGIDRTTKAYNSVHSKRYGEREFREEIKKSYTEQVDKMLEKVGRVEDYSSLRNYMVASATGQQYVDAEGNTHISAIPTVARSKIATVLNGNYMSVLNKEDVEDFTLERKKRFFEEYDKKAQNAIALKDTGFFRSFTEHAKATVGGKNISIPYENVAMGYNISQTNSQARAAVDNIKKNGFVAWDLETTAGNSKIGPKRYPGLITEFAFSAYDNTGKKMQRMINGKPADAVYNAIIGVSDADLANYEELLNRLKTGKMMKDGELVKAVFTEEEEVNVKRLALAGNAATVLDTSRESEGIWTFKTFAEEKDLALGGDSLVKDVENGIKLYRDAKKLDAVKVNFNINGKSFEVTGAENELLGGFSHIFIGGKTAVGYNSRPFDLHRMKQLMGSDRVSSNFKSALREMYSMAGVDPEDFNFPYHFDALAPLRKFINPNDFYTQEDFKEMKRRELHDFSQESIVRKITGGSIASENSFYKDQKAHRAATDIDAMVEGLKEGGMFGREMISEKRRKILEAGGRKAEFEDIYDLMGQEDVTSGSIKKGSVLYTKNFVDTKRTGGLLVFEDPDTGALITSDEYTFLGDNVVKDKYNIQPGAQRGVLYNVNDIRKLEFGSEEQKAKVIKALSKSNPNLAVDQLYAIEMQQFGIKGDPLEETVRSRGRFWYIDTMQNLQTQISNNFLLAGEGIRDAKGNIVDIDTTNVKDDVIRQLAPVSHSIDENGIGQFEYGVKDYTTAEGRKQVMDFAKSSSMKKSQEDAAARMNRKNSLRKDKRLVALFDSLNTRSEEIAKAMPGIGRTQAFKQAEAEYFQNSIKISKMLLEGKNPDSREIQDIWGKSFHATIGFDFVKYEGDSSERKIGLYSNTLSSQLARMKVLMSDDNAVYTRKAIEMAEAAGGGNREKANYAYKMIRENVTSWLMAEGKRRNAEALGYIPGDFVSDYSYTGRYEINLRGFKNINKNTPFTIYTDTSSPTSIVDRLVTRIRGGKKYSSSEAQVFLLKDLQNFLSRKGKVESLANDSSLIINGEDSAHGAAVKLLQHLNDTRLHLGNEFGHINGTGTANLMYVLNKNTLPMSKFEELGREAVAGLPDIISSQFDLSTRYNKDGVKHNKAIADFLADKLTNSADGILFSDVEDSELIKSGWSAKDIANIKKFRELKRAGAKEYYSKIFEAVGDMGGRIHIDKRTGRTIMAFGDEFHELSLISSKFENGQYVDRLGRNKVSLAVGMFRVDRFKEGTTLEETSVLQKNMNELGKGLYYAGKEYESDTGDYIYSLNRAISNFNMAVAGKSPTQKYLGINARSDQLTYTYEDLINNLGLIKDKLVNDNNYKLKGNEDTISDIWKKVEAARKNSSDPKFTKDEVDLLMVNFNTIQRAAVAQFGGNIANYSLKDFDPNSKYAYKFKGTVKENDITMFSEFVPNKRNTNRFDSRLNGKSDAINEILKLANSENPTKTLFIRDMGYIRQKDIDALQGIRLHGAMMKKDYAGTLQTDPRIMKNGFREARMNVLHTNTDILNREVNKVLEMMKNDQSKRLGKNISSADIDLISNMFLEEGHAYMHGQVFDTFFNSSESLQTIKFDGDKVLDADSDEILDIAQKKLAEPRAIISKEGKISFKYGKGSYVRRGDDVLSFRSQNKIMTRQAKTSGLLKFGFFDNNNNLVGEDKIADILESENVTASLANIHDEYERQAFIHDTLSQAGLTSAYYIQSEKANPYRKLLEDKEKNMTVGMIEYTGSTDKRIAKALKSLGFTDIGTKNNLEENNLLDIDLINSMYKGEEGDFWTVAAYRYNRLTKQTLTKEKMVEILGDAGFGDSEDLFEGMTKFRNAIMDERYRTSELAEAIFQQIGFLKEGEHFHLVTDNSSGRIKHKDLVALEDMVSNLLEKNLKRSSGTSLSEEIATEIALQDTAVQILNLIAPHEKANSVFDFDIEHKSLILKKDLSEIKLPSEEAFDSLIGEKGAFKRAQNKAELVVSTIRQLDFHDQEKFGDDAARPNQRTIANLSQIRYSEKGLEESKAFLEESGHAELFEKYFANVKDGQIVNSGAVHQIESRMFERGGREAAGFLARDTNGNFIWGIDDTVLEDIIKKNNIADGDIVQGKKILHALIEGQKEVAGIETFSEKGVLNLYEGTMNVIAAAHNRGNVSEEFAMKMGFKKIKIQDLILDNDGRIDQSVYGRNILVDLEDDYYGLGDKLFKGLKGNENGGRRTIAIAYTPTDTYKESEEYAKEPQNLLSKLKAQLTKYRESSGLVAGNEIKTEEDKAKYINRIIGTLNELDMAQYNQVASKKGVLAEVLRSSLADASYNTASGIDIMQLNTDDTGKVLIRDFSDLVADGEDTHSLRKLTMTLGGKKVNLMEEASKGEKAMQLNYTLVSKDKMRTIYREKYNTLKEKLIKGGMSEEQATTLTDNALNSTMDKVMTEGVTGLNYKEPTQYQGSVQGTRIYATDVVRGNQMITNFSRDEMGKIDFDSDKMFNGIHLEEVQIGSGSSAVRMKVDSAMYDVLKSSGLEISFLSKGAEQRLMDYEAAQVYIATDTAQRYRRLVSGAKEYDFSSFSTEYLRDKIRLREGMELYNTRELVKNEEVTELWHEYITQLEEQRNRKDQDIKNIVDQRLEALKYLDQKAKEEFGVDTVNEVTEEMNASLFKKFRALKFGQALEMAESGMLATTGQPLGAGIANSYTQIITNTTQRFLDENAEFVNDYYKKTGSKLTAGAMSNRMSLVTMALQEKFLSPKNEAGQASYLNEGQIKKTTEVFNAWINAYNKSDAEKERIQNDLTDLFYNALIDRPDKEILKDPMLPSRLELSKQGITDAKAYWRDLLDPKNINPETGKNDFLWKASQESSELMMLMHSNANLRGISQGLGSRSPVENLDRLPNQLTASLGGVHNTQGKYLRGVQAGLASMLGEDSAAKEIENLVTNLGELSTGGNVEDAIARAQAKAARDATMSDDILRKNLGRATKGMMSSIAEATGDTLKKGGLLGAAIGLAGGLILSGFAHDPKAPPPPEIPQAQHTTAPINNQQGATTVPVSPPPSSSQPQANDMLAAGADGQSPMPQQMSLADSGLNALMGNNNRRKSYTINISGNTSNTNRMNIANAMSLAISTSSINSGGALSVSMNNNYQDTLSQKQVDRMVRDSMGA